MSQSTPPSYPRSKEFAEIEAAMMRTEKGRAFLRDYLARNRSAETAGLLDAIAKFQRSLGDVGAEQRLENVRRDLTDLQRNMARSRRALANVTPVYAGAAKASIPHTAPLAADPRESVEVIAEAADTIGVASGMLRESGGDDRLCGQIERQLECIREACVVVQMNRERAKTLEAAFFQVEAEILAIIDAWDFHAIKPANKTESPRAIKQALMSGLAEELTIAMLTDDQKAALFH